MAKTHSVDAKLARLRTLRREAPGPDHAADLRRALSDASHLVVAEAATIVGERAMSDLAPELVAAFERFMIDPEETDKKCRAKNAIAIALNLIGYEKEDVFLRGIVHVQDPGWGEDEDAAAPLRANSALGLARINYRGILVLLADLLMDSTATARSAAAQALGETRSVAAVPLLRFKARQGDKQADVVGACLSALMAVDPVESLPFVDGFLRHPNDSVQEAAALALAESRRADALDRLIAHWPRARRDSLAETLLLAIALTRLPAALDFLLSVLAEADQPTAVATLSALVIHRHNDAVKSRIAAVLDKKNNPSLVERFHKKFVAKDS